MAVDWVKCISYIDEIVGEIEDMIGIETRNRTFPSGSGVGNLCGGCTGWCRCCASAWY